MQTDKKASPTEIAKSSATKKTTTKKAVATKIANSTSDTAKAVNPKKATTKSPPKKNVKTAKDVNVATKTTPSKISKKTTKIKLRLEIFFSTKFGETILISGAHPALGNESTDQAPVMEYIDDQKWAIQIELDKTSIIDNLLKYTYLIRYQDGTIALSAPYQLQVPLIATSITIRDAWNAPGFVENVFGSDALQVLEVRTGSTNAPKTTGTKKITHRFIITAPQLEAGKAICMIGEPAALGGWNKAKALVLNQVSPGKWSIDLSLKLSLKQEAVAYKYGIYDLATNKLDSFESGENRILEPDTSATALLIIQNGFIRTN